MTGIDEAILCINEAKNVAIATATARLFKEVNVQKSESKRIGYFVPVPKDHRQSMRYIYLLKYNFFGLL